MSAQPRPTCLITAPCNLGLRPVREDHEPGTWKAPQVLIEAGLPKALRATRTVSLPRPKYERAPQPGTRLLNGNTLRDYCLDVAATVSHAISVGETPFIVGGDCSLLLGALAGVRQSLGPLGLVHIDGHSDFRHPGNYDPSESLGAVAGMDLALATGRGEDLLTIWPGVTSPLIADEFVVQLGERESKDANFAWPDVVNTAMTRIDVFEARTLRPEEIMRRVWAGLNRIAALPFWVHFDVDVLDQEIMPAVDTPGSPGIDPEDLIAVLRELTASDRCLGMTLTIFDPDLDPNGQYARWIVRLIQEGWAKNESV